MAGEKEAEGLESGWVSIFDVKVGGRRGQLRIMIRWDDVPEYQLWARSKAARHVAGRRQEEKGVQGQPGCVTQAACRCCQEKMDRR